MMEQGEMNIDLTEKEKEELLFVAREALASAVVQRTAPCDGNHQANGTDASRSLRSPGGVFVTLSQHGRLRGCIGTTRANEPLYRAVVELAVSAGIRDPRFSPLTEEELNETRIEISVLSTFRTVDDIGEIVIEEHGLYVSQRDRAGLLLPQVAVQYGWDREEFVEQCCRKAGLSPDAWKDDATEIMVFSAIVFGETEDG